MKSLFNRRGFSLVEVMIGAGVLGAAALAYVSVSDLSNKAGKDAQDSFFVNRTIINILNELAKDSHYYPPLPSAIYSERTGGTSQSFFDDANKKQYLAYRCYGKFGTVEYSCSYKDGESCYDSAGKSITAGKDANCKTGLNLWFFKSAVHDRSFDGKTDAPSLALTALPMYRLNFKIQYRHGGEKEDRVYYFSQLQTETNNY